MSKDCRIDLIRALEEKLMATLAIETVESVINDFTQLLQTYEVTKRTTALTIYENENEKILKKYCACLFIDGKSEKTIAQYHRTVIKMTEMLQKLYTEIGPYDIRLFLAYEKSRGISNRTLENTRANLSAFFQWMTTEEIIEKNPCMSIKPIKYNDKQKFPFSAVEIDSLKAACKNDRERALIELLLSSGIRVSELSGLKLSDIDFDSMTVHVKKGKGNKSRITYINEIARKYLANYIEKNNISDILFLNQRGTQLQPDGIRYILKQIAIRANVENVHPHRFRRTFATNLANRGMSIQDIQQLLGHANISTTMGYVCTADERVKASYKQYIT